MMGLDTVCFRDVVRRSSQPSRSQQNHIDRAECSKLNSIDLPRLTPPRYRHYQGSKFAQYASLSLSRSMIGEQNT
jgi:hypothetical protein